MRLLKNISNEFKIYSEKLEKGVDKNKLLAMIVYKNIYPDDFSNLHNNKGMIYDAFDNRQKAISEITEELNEEIEIIKNEIKLSKEETLGNIQELRAVYISSIYEKKSSITGLKVNGARVEFKELKEDKFFYNLKENNEINYYHYVVQNNYSQINREVGKITTFKEIEKSISDLSYDEREKAIKNKQENKQEEMKKEIEKKEIKKEKIRTMKIEHLIKEYGLKKLFEGSIEDEFLLIDLVEDGYIDENYCDYTSIFHDEIIKREDNNFILSVKNNNGLGHNYSEISEFKEVIIRLSDRDFDKKSVLNFKLFDYILEHKYMYGKQYRKIFNQLKNESEESINFIFEYIEFDKYRKEFIKELASKWKNLWNFIEEKSNFTAERINKYLIWILEFSEIKDIERLNLNDSLKNYIENIEIILPIRPKKYQQVIEALDIKFKYINDFLENKKMFDYIYENNCYQINEKMINQIVLDKGHEGLEEELKIAHLTTIEKIEALEEMNTYIKNYVNEYIDKVLLKIETNIEESIETIIWLLNNEDLSGQNKIEIIRKENQEIDDIKKINNSKLWSKIVENNKMRVNWENILVYFESENFDEDILYEYLNQEKNYEILVKFKIKFENKEIEQKISRKILLSKKIDEEAYEYLIKSIPYWYESLELSNLSINKINLLLENEKLQVTQENIEGLKKKGKNQHITLIENLIEDYLENIDDIELESEDYIELLKSKKLEVSHKLQVFEKMDRSLIEDFVDEFIEIVIEDRKSDDDLFGLLNIENLSNENKIKIIEEVDEIIDDIKNIKDSTLWSEVIKNNKIKSSWNNLLAFYSNEEFDEEILIGYLNQEKNYETLSNEELKGQEGYEKLTLNGLEKVILKSSEIFNEAYTIIVKSFVGRWNSLDITELSEFKIEILLSNNLLSVNKKNINDLKEKFSDKHIELIESHIEEYLEEFDEINLEGEDYTKLLKSEGLEVSEKLAIINKLDMEGLDENTELISEISKIYIANPEKLDEELSKKLLDLLMVQIKYLSRKEIDNYISLVGEEYKGISYLEDGIVVYIDNTGKNKILVENLDKHRYISSFSINEKDQIKINKFRKRKD